MIIITINISCIIIVTYGQCSGTVVSTVSSQQYGPEFDPTIWLVWSLDILPVFALVDAPCLMAAHGSRDRLQPPQP